MKYVGLYTQQRRNNLRSVLLLILFPTIIVVLVWLFCHILGYLELSNWYDFTSTEVLHRGMGYFVSAVPWALGVVAIWFVIAYFFNTSMIRHATQAKPLERKDNPRVYNIVENLTMTCGMDMPQVNVIDSPQLNAFASGIDKKTYTVTVTTGLCDMLDDDEPAAATGLELTHKPNRDSRLLIVSTILVGIMSTVMALLLRTVWYMFVMGGGSSSRSRNDRKEGGGAAMIVVLLIAAVLAVIGYFFTLFTRFAISRKREYMADAGGAELTGNPRALASALRKISGNPYEVQNGRDDVQQLFIIHGQSLKGEGISSWLNNLFSTHPTTESRIKFLEQL